LFSFIEKNFKKKYFLFSTQEKISFQEKISKKNLFLNIFALGIKQKDKKSKKFQKKINCLFFSGGLHRTCAENPQQHSSPQPKKKF